jgi:hypothetical protein
MANIILAIALLAHDPGLSAAPAAGVPCDYCHGTGIYTSVSGWRGKCYTCQGTGVKQVVRPQASVAVPTAPTGRWVLVDEPIYGGIRGRRIDGYRKAWKWQTYQTYQPVYSQPVYRSCVDGSCR